MSEAEDTLEDAAAGLLNGFMLCAIGSAFPVLVAWAIFRQWGEWRLQTDPSALGQAVIALNLLFFSYLLIKTGVGLIRKSGQIVLRRSPNKRP